MPVNGVKALGERTSVHDVVVVQVIHSFQHLSNGLRGILLCESSLLANAIEEFSSSRQLCYNVIFILRMSTHVSPGQYTAPTLDSNQSTNLTM